MTYFCVSLLEFPDGAVSWKILQRGSLTDCTRVMEGIPGIMWHGQGKVEKASLRIIDSEQMECLAKNSE